MVESESDCEEEIELCSTYLMSFIEEQAEVGKDHPELLPAIAVLELSQQIS